MSNKEPSMDQIAALSLAYNEIAKQWEDKGKPIEGGWQAYWATYPLVEDVQVKKPAALEKVREKMRDSFMNGACYGISYLFRVLGRGDSDDVTDAERKKLEEVFKEIQEFELLSQKPSTLSS